MNKQTVIVERRGKNGLMQMICKGAIFQPELKFKGGTVPWFDDSKLLKKHRQKNK